MKLYKVIHLTGNELFVAAENLKKVAEVYEGCKSVELINDKIIVLRTQSDIDFERKYNDLAQDLK